MAIEEFTGDDRAIHHGLVTQNRNEPAVRRPVGMDPEVK